MRLKEKGDPDHEILEERGSSFHVIRKMVYVTYKIFRKIITYEIN